MKKMLVVLLVFVMINIFSVGVYARNGDVIGEAQNTDIVTYINHYALPCVSVNSRACIIAEDLTNFGFDVAWNEYDRSLTISRNCFKNTINPIPVTKLGACASKCCDILETDIEVFAKGKKLVSYAIKGYTLIPLEELAIFGDIKWNPEFRSLKLWVKDGLEMRPTPQKTINTVTEFTELLSGVWVNIDTYDEWVYDFIRYRRDCIDFGTCPGCYYTAEVLSAKEIGRNKYLFSVYYPETELYTIEEEYDTFETEFVYGEYPYSPGFDGSRWYNLGENFEAAGKEAKRFIRYNKNY